MKKEYRYGMRLRGFSPGCQPMRGLVERVDDPTGRYHDVLIYDRELTEQEVRDYELDKWENSGIIKTEQVRINKDGTWE